LGCEEIGEGKEGMDPCEFDFSFVHLKELEIQHQNHILHVIKADFLVKG